MQTRRRRLSVAALAAFLLAATSSTLVAQESTNTVGPPQLKDFSLPGQRTTPPATQPVIQQPLPQPRQTLPPAPRTAPTTGASTATPLPRSGPARRDERPARAAPTRPSPTGAPPASVAAGSQRPAGPPAAATLPATNPVPTAPALPGPSVQVPAPAPGAATPVSRSPINWLWLGGAAILALLAFVGLRRFGAARAEAGRKARREERAAARAAEMAEASAAAEAAAAELAEARKAPRARLELSFVPDRAVATDSETAVHYEMILRNHGEVSAHNIRIDARMFNAGAKAAIGAFLKGPIHDRSGSPQVLIEPGAELKLSSSIAMPKDEVKAIEVQGRSIFVPIVAINTAYDWGSGETAGTGRTSRSWLVGREPQAPSDKMGPFPLGTGPRIYRSVGQRPTELANVA